MDLFRSFLFGAANLKTFSAFLIKKDFQPHILPLPFFIHSIPFSNHNLAFTENDCETHSVHILSCLLQTKLYLIDFQQLES